MISRAASFFLLASVCLMASSCTKTYKGEGPAVVVERPVDNISRVAVNMSATVLLKDTTVSYCRVHVQENIQDAVITKQDGKTLYISSRGTLVTSEPVVVEVGMVRPQGVELNGSAEVRCVNTMKNDKLSFEVNGSGVLKGDIVALKTRSYVSGSGVVTLTGSTGEVSAEISGSGEVHAYGLSALDASADVSGSGKAELSAAQSLSVQISGSGKVYYKGNPEVKQRITGSGEVIKAN